MRRKRFPPPSHRPGIGLKASQAFECLAFSGEIFRTPGQEPAKDPHHTGMEPKDVDAEFEGLEGQIFRLNLEPATNPLQGVVEAAKVLVSQGQIVMAKDAARLKLKRFAAGFDAVVVAAGHELRNREVLPGGDVFRIDLNEPLQTCDGGAVLPGVG